MSSFTKACKKRKLIMMPIIVLMVLKIFTFGSSAPQKRSNNCQYSLSCKGALEKLKPDKKVLVKVKHNKETVLNETYNVSSLLKKGYCSVVVPKCLQEGTKLVFKIFDESPRPLYDETVQPETKSNCTTKGGTDHHNESSTESNRKQEDTDDEKTNEIVPKPVTGKRGGSVTLPCQFEDREISDIVLSSQSKNILVCQNEECESENDRVFKEGSCDVIIKDLKLSDAGKYFLRVYYNNDQRDLERQISIYHLHIHDEISVKTGEQLKMDVLLINVYQIEHQSKISTEWTEVWTRGDGVQNDRLTNRDGKLTINAFTASDAGTYRVLDSEGEIWITVTVTESSTGSKGKLDTDEDKPDEKYSKYKTGVIERFTKALSSELKGYLSSSGNTDVGTGTQNMILPRAPNPRHCTVVQNI